MEKVLISNSMEDTKEIAKRIAFYLNRGDVILLKGDLGAGKTTFVGGIAKSLGIKEDVISPTFNIMKCYFSGKIPLYHIDAYRLENQNIEIGLDEYIEGDGVCFIEWPDYISSLIPDEKLDITILNLGENKRQITLSSLSERFFPLLRSL
ncbi:MAG TPA: tRNA (adenosine(37)-N6)-threonylcarbamoyltransferase complex ATPase subunit type 1 TsaE [Firmicutes bacterium]|nr:tRNA (adenosine(37)-N6)-threonylcarbamoyltransferase complex ATPase subunit type 1 TsaE [Bacillota bacterium]HBM70203.1 tRNA (adenosine(37)-N6)-threonylcarbamoyltransferase complex ATPase subunit type 1 TsaE [Bacillota bacterium]HBX25721.1 tRNA (adenosine(37)-N6)-threonylcarbamoyltransferase complex ATPase subunit type 1 TsaE [Bacillota bacterium]